MQKKKKKKNTPPLLKSLCIFIFIFTTAGCIYSFLFFLSEPHKRDNVVTMGYRMSS